MPLLINALMIDSVISVENPAQDKKAPSRELIESIAETINNNKS